MEEEDEPEKAANIARRTRSHVKIDDSVLNDNLDLPDVDMKLYLDPGLERDDADPDYNNFLNRLYSDELGQDTNTDDNDTEYVYNNDIYSHGWAFDLNEVQEFQVSGTPKATVNDFDTDRKDVVTSDLGPLEAHTKTKQTRPGVGVFADPDFSRILNQQLRQHIQLLTQTYILTKNAAKLRAASQDVEQHLQSYLKIFKDRTKPSNLLPALELIKNYASKEQLRPSVRFTWRHLPLPDSIKKTIHDHPDIFIYKSLLPQVSYSFLERPKTKPEKSAPTKETFTLNEDKLLTYALHEFRGEPLKYDLISSLLMTTKTKKQIINHVKNIKRSSAINNPIKLYFEEDKLPLIDQESNEEPQSQQEIAVDQIATKQESLAEEVKVNLATVELDADEAPLHPRLSSPNFQQSPPAPAPAPAPDPDPDPQPSPAQAQASPSSPCCEVHYDQLDRSPSMAELSMELCEKNQECDMMDMDLDDLVAASSTISKVPTYTNNINNSENKFIRNLKLRRSMIHLMSHNFTISDNMGSLMVETFLGSAKQKLHERAYLHLLQLLADLGRKEDVEYIYHEIIKFLNKVEAPQEFHDRVVLFLDLKQATKCGCAMSYLHWMRFFQFMQHIELHHDGVEILEKKLVRLIDALQKDDSHKIKLAVANMINKHPYLRREFDSLCLNEKPHQSLFICEEDFDDITEPLSQYESRKSHHNQVSGPCSNSSLETESYKFEHFSSKVSKEEICYASQHCPCKCHKGTLSEAKSTQHCGRCNLKFMRGRMYLVNKIKPILAEWSYIEPTEVQWTFEEDRDILEFCRCKAERSEETVSFDTQTFEELANGGATKKTAREIAKRFNDLMDIYKDSIGQQQQQS